MERQKPLNRNQIKYIIIVAMVIDHIAWNFVDGINPLLGQVMHFIGRLTGPTMAYFVGEGYAYTRDVKKYQLRLGLFALLSWFPFLLFEFDTIWVYLENGHRILNPTQGVIFTLFLGITAIRLWEKEDLHKAFKIIGILFLCLLAFLGDWFFMDVLGVLFVHIYRDRPKAKWISFTLVFTLPTILLAFLTGIQNNWFQIGVLLPPLMLYFLYNGKSGSKAPIHKWFFYLFYPAHFLVLVLIQHLLF